MSAADQAEEIGDTELISRLVDEPRMYTADKGLIWPNVFEFPQSQHESTVWRRHAPKDNDVHEIGFERERRRRDDYPDRSPMRYVGFITSQVGEVRSLKNARGHGFSVDHLPEDRRRYHAGISYAPAPGVSLSKNDKTELKQYLRQVFGPLASHGCDET